MRRLATVAVLILAVAACGGGTETGGGDTTTSTSAVETTTTTAETTTPTKESTTSVAEPMDVIHAADSGLGSVLVDPEGFTLYIFTNDTAGESTCYDACAESWPAVPADTSISSDLDDSRFGSTTRSDGTTQLTVNGMPLYRFAADTEPGQTNGQGVGGIWFVVDPDGSPIGPETGEQGASTTSDYGYDY